MKQQDAIVEFERLECTVMKIAVDALPDLFVVYAGVSFMVEVIDGAITPERRAILDAHETEQIFYCETISDCADIRIQALINVLQASM